MKLPGQIYAALSVFGMVFVAGVVWTLWQGGSHALPGWTGAVRPGALSEAHAFLGDKCESCHAPVKGVTAQKCVTCHAPAPELLMKPATAFHQNIGDCKGCHVEHQGRAVRPTKMDHAVLEAVARRRDGGSGSLQCATCHAVQDPHGGFFGKQCASCHQTESWEIKTFLHPSPKSTDCAQCHKAPPSHYMMHFEMMDRPISGQKGARVEQCYLCHQTDSFNNIKGVGMVKVH